MAKKKADETQSHKLLDYQYASANGFSLKLYEKNREILNDIGTVLSDLREKENKVKTDGQGVVGDIGSLILRTSSDVTKENIAKHLDNDRSGFLSAARSLSKNEKSSGLVEDLVTRTKEVFSVMPEYMDIVELIPEIKKVIGIIAKDVRNANEFTKKYLTNLIDNVKCDTEAYPNLEDRIRTEVVEAFNLEEKGRIWMEESLITGVKPISVHPIGDLFEETFRLEKKKKSTGFSMESFVEEKINEITEESFIDNTFAQTEFLSEEAREEYEDSFEDLGVVTDTMADEMVDILISSEQEKLHELTYSRDLDPFSVSTEAETISKRLKEFSTESEDIRRNTKTLLKGVTQNVLSSFDTVKDGKEVSYFTYRDLKKKQAYSKKDENRKKRDEELIKKLGFSNIEYNEDDKDRVNKYPTDVMIIEHEPDDVIPITIGSEHIGYYVFERLSTSVSKGKIRKSSIADIFKKSGFNTDKGTTDNRFNNLLDVVSETGMFDSYLGGTKLERMSSGNDKNDKSSRRKLEFLKELVVKTVSRRMNDPRMYEDQDLRNAIYHIMRDSIVSGRKVRIAFIPKENMVYMSYKIDKNGMPVSIMDGTLLRCYMYLASLFSSAMIKIMKSADKETVELNIGRGKELGPSIAELDRSFSTRNLHAGSLFRSTSSVLKNVAVFQRHIVPVINGEKLYNIESMDSTVDYSVDDDFTEKQLSSIVSKIGAPPSILNLINEIEYARELLYQNNDYRTDRIDDQGNYGEHWSKLVRLIAFYKGMELPVREGSDVNTADDEERKNKDVSMKKRALIPPEYIKVRFNPPNQMGMRQAAEDVSEVTDLVDKLTDELFDEDDDTKITKVAKIIFRKELLKKFVSSIEWDSIEDVIEDAYANVHGHLLLQKKREEIDKQSEDDDDGGGSGYY